MKISIDTDVCIGFGNCERTCPGIFKVASGISYAQVEEVQTEDEKCVRAAVDDCPSDAISIDQ